MRTPTPPAPSTPRRRPTGWSSANDPAVRPGFLRRAGRMTTIQLGVVDHALLLVYFSFVLGIGLALRRSTASSREFFQAGRSIPAWITGLAFISANLGAQEVMGM